MVVIQQTQSAIMNPPAARAARAHTRPMIMKRTLPPPDPTRQPIARTMPSDRTIPEIKEQQRGVAVLGGCPAVGAGRGRGRGAGV